MYDYRKWSRAKQESAIAERLHIRLKAVLQTARELRALKILPLAMVAILFCVTFVGAESDDRPNIILIVSEDNGPELGCYGGGKVTDSGQEPSNVGI